MAGNLLNRARHIAALLGMLILTIHPATAETVEAKLPTGIIASADFRAGQPSHPAILLLHGFLQTRHAPPISSLANTLADQGYTVLSPTLSLDIYRRSKSLSCEAVHTHTMEGDIAEIDFWVNWLVKKGYRSIALVGHSAGSTQILHYISQHPSPAVKKAILTSLIGFLSDPADHQLAREQARIAPDKLGRYTLSYCKKNYTTPAGAYLSYVDNTTDKTLALLSKAKLPTEVILGANDATMGKGWPERLNSKGIAVTVIANTGHFFDGEAEFDLAEKLESQLKSLPPEK
jgi:pimeloyl-ACP methyl ester carboxylesterase